MSGPILRRPTRLLHAAWILALLVLVAALGMAIVVQVEKVVRAVGQVRAREPSAPIVSPVQGRIHQVHVREGDSVRKGDPLLTIEPDANGLSIQEARLNVARWRASHAAYAGLPPSPVDPGDPVSAVEPLIRQGIEAELQAARAHLVTIAEQLAESRAQVEVEAATLRRQQALEPLVKARVDRHADLVRAGFESPMSLLVMQQEQVDAQEQVLIARKRLTRAQEAVKRSRASLEAAQRDFDRLGAQRAAEAQTQLAQAKAALQRLVELSVNSAIASPIDGVIEHVLQQVAGNAVRSGERLMSVVPTHSALELQLTIRNEDYPFVEVGQKVDVKFEAYPFTVYGSRPAVIVRLLREALDGEHGLSSYVAIAHLLPQPGGATALDVRPGMALRADIQVGMQRPIDIWLEPFLRFGQEALRERR